MVKKIISSETMLDLKIAKLERIIESLQTEIPLEGKKWQRGMVAHYTEQLNELREARDGLRRSK